MSECALLFTDLADSTRLVERLGDARASEVWAEHDRRARALLALHDGREIDRADGFFLLFDHPLDAARYALDYHQALAKMELRARAGLHVGTVSLRENAPGDVARGAKRVEVEGLAKPFAARIMALARPGQTLLSAAARAALASAAPDGAVLESHGHYRLKGLQDPVEIFELGWSGAALAPPEDVDKAYRVVRIDDGWRPVRDVRHSLPLERDAFVGRTGELRALAARLDAGARLISVLGQGGTGKTRLVGRYGWTWLGDWPGGVYFADLSEARTLDAIWFAVAGALDVRLGEDPAEQLGHAIGGRGRCLVILDNFEQIVTHAAASVGGWLDMAREATFVVTSRERLHLAGEEVLLLEPLPVEQEGIELFVARARSRQPEFALTAANRPAVAEVVTLLDGLPLAIELAAARVRVLSPAQLVERMRDRFGILADQRGTVARQSTLRAAIDWSWELLAAWEQAALAQCSVFEGGFTLEAAEAVLDLSQWREAPPTMDVVQALVDKSLLRSVVPAGYARFALDEPYFGMYLSIHEYAAEKLEASPHDAARAAHARHGAYFTRFGTDDAVQALYRHGGVRLFHALALELDNLAAACRRAVARRDAVAAVATYRAAWEVLDLKGPFSLAATLGDLVLALDGLEGSTLVQAQIVRAQVARRSGQMGDAEQGLQRALALVHMTGDRRREGRVLGSLGIVCREQGRMREALTYYEEALALHRNAGNRVAEGGVHGYLANLHAEQGRMVEAREHYEQALAIDREIGYRMGEGVVLGNMGSMYHDRGQLEEAQHLLQQALDIHREVGNRSEEGIARANLGALDQNADRLDAARGHYEAALAIARETGNRRLEGYVLGSLGNVHVKQGHLAEAQAHFELALTIDRAVGNRRAQGAILGGLADLAIRQGRAAQAPELLKAGETVLREIGDRAELANLLCIRARLELGVGDKEPARTTLADAETLANEMGSEPDSEIRQAIAALRGQLG